MTTIPIKVGDKMSEWQKVKIGDLFNIEKGSLQSSKCTDGDFDFITASCDWKKHNECSHETEALIVAVAASGSLGRVHYVNGKFISSDLCFILTPKNPDKYPLDFEFYFHILRSVREDLVKSTATGTSKLAINRGNFSDYKLPYFDIEHQKKFCKKLINLESNKEKLNQNSSFQKSHLSLLRQQILQDAISGKLTADWRAENPDTEPASKLLQQIKAEKEKLIADPPAGRAGKKIKKEKPLPKITENEVPFELPEGWEWCRLGEITEIVMGQSPSGDTYNQRGNGIPFFQGKKEFGDIYPIGNSTWCSEPKRLSKTNDILISVRAPVGDVNLSDKEYAIGRGLSIIRTFSENNLDYWFLFYFLRAEQRNWKKKGSFFDSINRNVIEEKMIPLPPFAEQKAIVAKLSRLMGYVSELEKKIAQNANNAETLMQAFLGEVFRK